MILPMFNGVSHCEQNTKGVKGNQGHCGAETTIDPLQRRCSVGVVNGDLTGLMNVRWAWNKAPRESSSGSEDSSMGSQTFNERRIDQVEVRDLPMEQWFQRTEMRNELSAGLR